MSQEAIYNLSRINPTVQAWITNYQYNKDITYVDALEGMVISLVEQNRSLTEQMIKHLSESTKSLHTTMLIGK